MSIDHSQMISAVGEKGLDLWPLGDRGGRRGGWGELHAARASCMRQTPWTPIRWHPISPSPLSNPPLALLVLPQYMRRGRQDLPNTVNVLHER